MATNKKHVMRLLGHNVPNGVKNPWDYEQDPEQNIQPKVTATLFMRWSLQENCERRDKERYDNQDNVCDGIVVAASLTAHLE